jgi:hypothetical protein
MSITYCPDCGKKHEYNFAKPNFCSGCGLSFGVAKLKTTKKATIEEDEEDSDEEYFEGDDDDFSDATHVPHIRKIQVDIEVDEQYNTFDLGSIVGGTSAPASKASAPRRRSNSLSIEDFKQNKR